MASDLRELADTVRRLSSQVETLTRERDESREEIGRMRALVVEHVSATRTMSRNVSSSNEQLSDFTVRMDGRMETLQDSVQHSIRDMARMVDTERQSRMATEEALSSRLTSMQRQLADVAVIAASARAALDTASASGTAVIINTPGGGAISTSNGALSPGGNGGIAPLSPSSSSSSSPRRGKKAVLPPSYNSTTLQGSILGFDRGEPPELEPLDEDGNSFGRVQQGFQQQQQQLLLTNSAGDAALGSGAGSNTAAVAALNGAGRLLTRTAFEAAMGAFRTSLEGLVESRVRELANTFAQQKAMTEGNMRDLRRGLELAFTAQIDNTSKSLASAVAEVATNVASVQAQSDALQGALDEEARRSAERSARCMEAVVSRYDSLGMQLQQTQTGVETRLNAVGDALLRGLAEEGELRESSIAALSSSLRSELRDYSVKWRDFALSVESLRREVGEQISKAVSQTSLDADLSISALKATLAAHTTSHVSDRVNAMRDETKALIQMALKDSVEPLNGRITQDISRLNTAMRDEISRSSGEIMEKVAALQSNMADGPVKALESRLGQLETTAASASDVSALRAKVDSGSALVKAELSAVQLYVGLLPQAASSSSSSAMSPASPGGGQDAFRLASPPLSPGGSGASAGGLQSLLLSSAPPLLERVKSALMTDLQPQLEEIKESNKRDDRRLTALEEQNKSDSTRLSSLEEQNKSDDARLKKLEEQNQQDDQRLTALEGQNKSDDERITALEGQNRKDEERLTMLEAGQKKDDERLSLLEEHDKSAAGRIQALENRQTVMDAAVSKLSGENLSDDARASRLEDQNKSDDERLTKLESLTTSLQEQLDRHTEQLTETCTQEELQTMEHGILEKVNAKVSAATASLSAAIAASPAAAPRVSAPPMMAEVETPPAPAPAPAPAPLPPVKEKAGVHDFKNRNWSTQEHAAALRIQSSAKDFLAARRATRRQVEEPPAPAPAPEPAPEPAPAPAPAAVEEPDAEVLKHAAAMKIQNAYRASKRNIFGF